jgi:hypothetical protein
MALCMGHVSAPLGSLAALLGRWDEADRLFARALAHARGLRSPVLVALAELDQAAALLERGRPVDRRRSDGLIRSAATAATSLYLPGLLERARGLAER